MGLRRFLSFHVASLEFLGSLVEKFMNGCLGNKVWPHGAITVGEVAAKYSYLGVKPYHWCCKYQGIVYRCKPLT